MNLTLRSERYAVVRLAGNRDPAPFLAGGGVRSVVRSERELSVWLPESDAPTTGTTSTGWRLLVVEGPLELSLTGVLVALLGPLADAGVSVFPFASYDTDWIGVPETQLTAAVNALEGAGHSVIRDGPSP